MNSEKRTYIANEGENFTLNLVSELDLTGTTITARMRLVGGTGVGSQVASISGVSAGSLITLPLAIANFDSGTYEIEVYSNYGLGTQKLITSNNRTSNFVEIRRRFSIDIETGVGFGQIEINFTIG